MLDYIRAISQQKSNRYSCQCHTSSLNCEFFNKFLEQQSIQYRVSISPSKRALSASSRSDTCFISLRIFGSSSVQASPDFSMKGLCEMHWSLGVNSGIGKETSRWTLVFCQSLNLPWITPSKLDKNTRAVHKAKSTIPIKGWGWLFLDYARGNFDNEINIAEHSTSHL